MLVEVMEVDGVVVIIEGFGNNYIDFVFYIE